MRWFDYYMDKYGKKMAMTVVIFYVGYFAFIWMGNQFDASPTMRDNVPSDARDCQEDMPCWDCHTMGNLICGKAHDA